MLLVGAQLIWLFKAYAFRVKSAIHTVIAGSTCNLPLYFQSTMYGIMNASRARNDIEFEVLKLLTLAWLLCGITIGRLWQWKSYD